MKNLWFIARGWMCSSRIVLASLLGLFLAALRVGDHYVKVLTLKEPSAHTFPLLLKGLLDVRANFHVVTEWKKEEPGKTRRNIQAKRRHFHNTKRSFFSQVNLNDAPAQDTLLDDAKESQVRELGKGIEEIELHGNYFGQFSLTVVIYDLDLAAVERAAAEVYKVFGVHDAQLYDERYNLLNAFLAAVPGNYAFNLRYLYLLNTNYADLSFLFTLHSGETRNQHLRQEYLAVLETNHGTPYYLNLHYRDVAHSMILGRTGSGKSFLLNFLITNLQKYNPFTFIFDLGGSFESLTRLFGGSYLRVGLESSDFTINPFCLPPTKCEQMLASIARGEDLCRSTLGHIKHFLSGVFRYARRQGVLDSANPMRDVEIPRATGRRNPCLYARGRSADARDSSRTRRDDCCRRGVHGCPQGRNPRLSLAELRRLHHRGKAVRMAKPGRRTKAGEEQRNHSGDRTVKAFSRSASSVFRKSLSGIYLQKSLGEPAESRCARDGSNSTHFRSGEDSVVRLARVSARTGYESSPARRFRQSHSADSASRKCDHHD